ncbi:hypothetical protein [Amycolatopsis taiwanensis]|nr:hypothetical protein [Amycolatopsis taiwanensis]
MTAEAEKRAKPDRLFVSWQTSIGDGFDHAITDEEFTVGHRRQRGEFEAVCGAVICLADSHSPPGPSCPRCSALVLGPAIVHRVDLGRRAYRHRRPGLLRRLFGHATVRNAG